LRLYFYF